VRINTFRSKSRAKKGKKLSKKRMKHDGRAQEPLVGHSKAPPAQKEKKKKSGCQIDGAPKYLSKKEGRYLEEKIYTSRLVP